MRQTLLRIPVDADFWLGFGYVPGFGFGLVLLLWGLFGALSWYWNRKNIGVVPVVLWVAVAFVIVKAPDWAQRTPRSIIAAESAVLEKQPSSQDSVEHYLARGEAYEQVYEYQNAERDYQSAIEAAPDHD